MTAELFTGSTPTSEHRPVVSREISPARCGELLRSHCRGRVAWNAPDGPQILPVSYAMLDKWIILRTSPYGLLSQLVRRQTVAFEVEELQRDSTAGWTVLVRGTVQEIDRANLQLGRAVVDTVTAWGPGSRTLLLAITAGSVSGREFHGMTFSRAATPHLPQSDGTAVPTA